MDGERRVPITYFLILRVGGRVDAESQQMDEGHIKILLFSLQRGSQEKRRCFCSTNGPTMRVTPLTISLSPVTSITKKEIKKENHNLERSLSNGFVWYGVNYAPRSPKPCWAESKWHVEPFCNDYRRLAELLQCCCGTHVQPELQQPELHLSQMSAANDYHVQRLQQTSLL